MNPPAGFPIIGILTAAVITLTLGSSDALGAPVFGNYDLAGRSVGLRLEPNHKPDRHVTRLEATAKVTRKKVTMSMKGTDESNETYQCKWTMKLNQGLKNGPRRLKRTSTITRSPCDRSRWSGDAHLTFTKRAGERRLSIRIEVEAVGGRDQGDTAKLSLNGKRT